MWGNLGSELSPGVAIVSAVLVVVVLVIALSLRNKIQKTERGNEFLFWGKQLEEEQIEEELMKEAQDVLEEEGSEEDDTE